MSSFRRRIQSSTLALIVLLLVTSDITVYLGLRQVLHHHVDSKLHAMAEVWAELARRNLGLLLDAAQTGQDAMVSPAISSEDEQIELKEAALSIEVLALDGTVLWKGAAVVSGPPADPSFLEAARGGEETFATVTNRVGASVRRLWFPVVEQEEVQYILQAEMPLRFVEKALHGLAVLLAAVSGLVLLLAWLGSRWLARQALMPVAALSATASSISESSSLSTRLQLDGSYDEFRRLAQAFNTMMDRIQKMVEAQRRFVTDAAHEIQTPLTALKGNLEVAFMKNRRASEYRETLIANLSAVDRLMNLCRSLITLARLAGGGMATHHRPIDLEALLKELVDDVSVLGKDRGIHLLLEVRPAVPVMGNPEQLQRVFINLIDNALRYTPSGGEVAVRLTCDGEGQVLVTVADTGEGIPAAHIPRIFDRFYRVDSARARASGGVGLGLAIVKEIVEAHGGSISVTSAVGNGTSFAVRFPGRRSTTRDAQLGRRAEESVYR